jgi:hypothetical protein
VPPTVAELDAEQRELLQRLGALGNERTRVTQRHLELDEEIAAARLRLEGIRDEILRQVFDERLAPQGLAYTLFPSGAVGVFPMPGGEAAFARFAEVVEDPANCSVNEVLNYLGVAAPWVIDA